ncbi:hypothetical protein ABEO76_21400 [Bacillus anthracis]|uniref:hypothetical protein n=1 Tax=Bacillus anthracis TaxID=1392 RepID=UPI003D23A757
MEKKIQFTNEEKELLKIAEEALSKITDRIAIDDYEEAYRLWNCYIELNTILAISE